MGKKHHAATSNGVGLHSYQFAKGLPEKDILYKNILIFVAEYEERRRQEKNLRRTTIAPIGDVQASLQLADSLIFALNQSRLTPIGDEYDQQKHVKKQLAAIDRALKTDDKKIVPFGTKTISLIHIISLLVLQELDDLSRTDPSLFSRYTSGKDRVYWFRTTTQSLCALLNKAKINWSIVNGSSKDRRNDKDFQNLTASFRGEEGFYNGMFSSGFLTDKVNLDRNLNDHEDGRDVRLGINLDWIFAHSANLFTVELNRVNAENTVEFSLKPPENPFFTEGQSGNSSHLVLNSYFVSKETENKEKCASLESSAPEGAQEKFEESEEKTTLPPNDQKNKENISPRAAIFVEKPEEKEEKVLMECAADTAKRAMKHLFNRENEKNGRIKYGYNSQAAEITPQDLRDIAHWTADVYRAIRKPEETWIEVAKVINEAIENTTQYLGEHPTRWIYHPKFWFSTDFNKGSLLKYLNVGLSRPTYEKTSEKAAESTNFGNFTPQIAWFLQAGANPDAVKSQIRRLGEDAVSKCIALAGARMHPDQANPFKPQNGKVPYIFGILKKCNPGLISTQAERAIKALGLDKPKPKAIWTVERVRSVMERAVKNHIWRELISDQMIQKVATKFAYMNASEAQIGDIFYQYCFINHEKLGV
jgi:hypothetical protein